MIIARLYYSYKVTLKSGQKGYFLTCFMTLWHDLYFKQECLVLY